MLEQANTKFHSEEVRYHLHFEKLYPVLREDDHHIERENLRHLANVILRCYWRHCVQIVNRELENGMLSERN